MNIRKTSSIFLLVIVLLSYAVRVQAQSIIIDGSFNDWEGVPVFLTDPENDGAVPSEDISTCKITHSTETGMIYFLYNHYNPQPPQGAIMYSIWMDTRPGGKDPEGTDYVLTYGLESEVNPAYTLYLNLDGEPILNEFDEGLDDFIMANCEGLEAAHGPGPDGGLSIEFCLPMECIGSPDCFEVSYFTHYFEVQNSDYAPDLEEGSIVYQQYCIPPEPVGGELVPNTWTFKTTSIILLIVSALILGNLKQVKPKIPHIF